MDLLERDACLRELDRALAEAAGGAGRVALVSGEAGIGKTALVERFAIEKAGSVRVLWGACDALFTPRPLGPLHDLAAQAKGEFAALLAAGADRAAVFAAALGELQRRPIMAVFEDVHWADEATLDLLRFVGRRIARTMALLVLTYRDDELGARHPLRALLGDLAASSAVRRVALAPLSERAVRALIGARPVDAAALHGRTGGNPFFVTEALAGAGDGVPLTVRDAVLARAARLSPSAHAALQAAAVVGPRVEPWLLAAVTGAEAAAVEDCLAAGMLVGQGELLAFRHELARQAVLESISPPRRIALHRMTLDALRAAPGGRRDLARLAHHAAGAGDREAVLAFAPAAARQASDATAHRSAAALYRLALDVAAGLPPATRATLLDAYARECDLTDQRLEGIAALQQAIALWRDLGDPLKQGEKLAQLVPMLRALGRDADAERSGRAALEVLEGLPPGPELALAFRMQAVLRLAKREIADAIDWGEQAIALAERLGDDDVPGMTHVIVGAARLYQDFEQGRAYLERRLAIALAAGQDRPVCNAYTYLGACSAELHQFRRAERYLADGIAYAAARDLDAFGLHMLAWQALTHLHLGRWGEAAEAGGRVISHPGVSSMNRIPALVALGRLGARQGDPDARATLDEALALALPTGNIQYLGLAHCARAEAAWLAGDRDRLLAEAGPAHQLMLSKQHPWFAGELAYWRRRAGETVTCPVWLAEPFARQIAGDWRAAAESWERLGCPYERARALADGDAAAQAAALAIFDQLGARPAAAELRRRMRAGGAARIPRGPRHATRANPFGLTARQMEILGLLADGLSNAEIAARLSVAPKTVDHHVSAVLARLDVHTREAAAALARRRAIVREK
jgi:DNA-binding CsgD family transcriptional regulator